MSARIITRATMAASVSTRWEVTTASAGSRTLDLTAVEVSPPLHDGLSLSLRIFNLCSMHFRSIVFIRDIYVQFMFNKVQCNSKVKS